MRHTFKHSFKWLGVLTVLALATPHLATATGTDLEGFKAQLATDFLNNVPDEMVRGALNALQSFKSLHDQASTTVDDTQDFKITPELMGMFLGAAQIGGVAIPAWATDFKSKMIETDLHFDYTSENDSATMKLSSEFDYNIPASANPKPTDPTEIILPTEIDYHSSWSHSVLNINSTGTANAVKVHTRLNVGNIYVKSAQVDFSQPGLISGKFSISALGGLFNTDIKFSFKLPSTAIAAQSP